MSTGAIVAVVVAAVLVLAVLGLVLTRWRRRARIRARQRDLAERRERVGAERHSRGLADQELLGEDRPGALRPPGAGVDFPARERIIDPERSRARPEPE